MSEAELSAALQRPQVHRDLLGSYRGPYSLGVTRSPQSGRPALLLRVEGEAEDLVPAEITIDGEAVPVIAHGGFTAPRAN